jgi:septal ring factor EnvC (AmiA/AmiB activator)
MAKKTAPETGTTSTAPASIDLEAIAKARASIEEAQKVIDAQKASVVEAIAKLEVKRNELKTQLAQIDSEMNSLRGMIGIQTVRARAKKLKDPQTGTLFGSYSEACQSAGIEVGAASAHVKWLSSKGYDLLPAE